MKKILLSILSLCALCTTATAQVAQQVASQYHGELIINLEEPINEESEPIYCQTIDLTAAGDNAINFALHNFSFSGLDLGDISISEIGVTTESNKVLFAEKDPVSLVLGDGMIEATAQVNPTTSYVVQDSIVVNLDIMWTNTGGPAVPIYVRFIGTKCKPVAWDANGLVDNYATTITDLYASGDEEDAAGTMSVVNSAAGDGLDFVVNDFTYNGVNYGDLTFSNLHFINRVFLDEDVWTDYDIISEALMITKEQEGKTLEVDMYGDEAGLWYDESVGKDFIGFYVYVTDDNWENYTIYLYICEKEGASILGIDEIKAERPVNNKVYSIDGRYMGNSLNGLSRGIYVVGGKKVFKK